VSWAVDDFVASLAGASGHTAEAYARDVRQFVAWAERGGCASPDQLDHTTLRRYLAYLTTRQFARRSIARKAASLRAYLRYLHHRGVIATGKFADVIAFDPETFADRATYEQPREPCVGVEHVFVNGQLIVRGGVPECGGPAAAPGRYLRRGR